jgi:hypothetical protein
MDVDLGRTFVGMAPSGRACLLAWLILVLAAPAPAVLSGGVDCVSESESGGEDGAPEDTSPAENETAQDVSPVSVLRRTHGLGRPESFASVVHSPHETHLSPRPRGQRPDSVPLPDDGRTLRIRHRSLTC